MAAVIVKARLAVMNCQYVCHTESREELLELVRTPATRIIVHMMVRMVRQSVEAKINFCVHRTLTFQIICDGITSTHNS